MMHTAYIALGSNLGNRQENLHRAVQQLNESGEIKVERVSSFFDNPAVGGPADSPPFLNAAAEVKTTLAPHNLLNKLHEIESAMGRVRVHRNEPRIIDLDLLIFEDQVIRDHQLDLPHPRMHDREFVLKPLTEIAPDLPHPLLKLTMRELLDACLRKSSS